MDETLNGWFAREILPYEAALVGYLLRIWPNQSDIVDLRQEIYIRVYESARKSRPHSPKAFLFVTARNLITDRVRRGRIVSIEALGDLDESLIPMDDLTPERYESGRQELKRVARAFRRLPPKCREVVWLRRVDELSQKEVARRLGVGERTVEAHLMRGMRLVADNLFSGDTHGGDENHQRDDGSGARHGHGQDD